MPPPKVPADAPPDDANSAEQRMRRALGLQGTPAPHAGQQRPEQARTRHRFVQDGEVPVVVVNGAKPQDAASNGRATALQAALAAERAARAGAERSLAEARATVQSLRTKLAHAELAHGETLAAERRAREAAEAALHDAIAAREAGERKLAEAAQTRATEAAPAPRATAKRAASDKPASSGKSASKAPAATAREPQPVKWWLPGYKAKTKAR